MTTFHLKSKQLTCLTPVDLSILSNYPDLLQTQQRVCDQGSLTGGVWLEPKKESGVLTANQMHEQISVCIHVHCVKEILFKENYNALTFDADFSLLNVAKALCFCEKYNIYRIHISSSFQITESCNCTKTYHRTPVDSDWFCSKVLQQVNLLILAEILR